MSLTVSQNIVSQKLKAYYDITKFRLSSTVVFSGAFGFIIASEKIDWAKLVLFCIAAFSTSSSVNIINQIIETDLDQLMRRTESRPLPSGQLTVKEAAIFGCIMSAVAMFILFFVFNVKAGLLVLLSMILYLVCLYTIKKSWSCCSSSWFFTGCFSSDDRLGCCSKSLWT